jgi:hypothetical protein
MKTRDLVCNAGSMVALFLLLMFTQQVSAQTADANFA